jgi:ribosomal protein L16 Arg81 hydroxylase
MVSEIVSSIADIVGDEASFFSGYFDKAPLLRRGGLQVPPQSIFSLRDCEELLHQEALRSEYVVLAKNGKPIHRSAYTKAVSRRDGCFDDCISADQVYSFFEAGASIIWAPLNHIHPQVRAVCGVLADRFSARCDASAILTPKHSRGFVRHHDSVDTYIIQVQGSKNWTVWPTPEVRPVAQKSYKGEPVEGGMEFTLEAGDFLYMPYGTPHVAETASATSLHLTFTVHQTMWSDLVKRTVQKVTGGAEGFDLSRYDDGIEFDVQVEEFKNKLRELTEGLTSLDVKESLLQALNEGRPSYGTSTVRRFE